MRTNALVVLVILLVSVVICTMMMTVTGECVRSAEYEAAQAESAYNKNLRIMARDLDSALQAKQTADDSKGIPDGMTITYVGEFDCTAYDINCDTCCSHDGSPTALILESYIPADDYFIVKTYKKRCTTYRKNGCYFVEGG